MNKTLTLAALSVAGVGIFAAPASATNNDKVYVCHWANGHPHVINISENALGGHFDNHGVPVPGHEYDENFGSNMSDDESRSCAGRIIVITGPAGPKGDKGDTGETGEAGPAGPAGEAGPAGPVGPAGANGEAGAAGADGKSGEAGLAGAPGTAGLNGLDGAAGAAGPAGPAGANGVDGVVGVTPTTLKPVDLPAELPHTGNGELLMYGLGALGLGGILTMAGRRRRAGFEG